MQLMLVSDGMKGSLVLQVLLLLLLGTSNWSGDYFESTGGVSIVVNQTASQGKSSLQLELRDVFLRDWNSSYTTDIYKFTP